MCARMMRERQHANHHSLPISHTAAVLSFDHILGVDDHTSGQIVSGLYVTLVLVYLTSTHE